MTDSEALLVGRAPLGSRPLSIAAHLLPWIAIVVVFFALPDRLTLGANVFTMALFALSLDIALGYAGIVSLGHAAFYGVGCYAAAICAIHITPDPLLGLLFATFIAALFGLITGMMILHTRGATLMMLTLAIAALVAETANQAHVITCGDDGLQMPDLAPVVGLFSFDLYGRTAYFYSAAVLLLWFVLSWRLVKSPFGRSINGVRQNVRRMRAIGTPVWARLVATYALSAGMAGSAGALAAQSTGTVGLNAMSLLASGTVLMVLALGGMGRLYGALLGALVYVVLQDMAAEIDPFRWMFVIGALMICVVLFLDDGFMGLANWVRRRLAGGRR